MQKKYVLLSLFEIKNARFEIDNPKSSKNEKNKRSLYKNYNNVFLFCQDFYIPLIIFIKAR